MGRAAGSPRPWLPLPAGPRLPSPQVRWEGFTVGPQAQVSRQTGREELVNLHPRLARPPRGDSHGSSQGSGSPAAGEGSGGMRPGEAAEGRGRSRGAGRRAGGSSVCRGGAGLGPETALHGQLGSREGAWEGPSGRRGGPGLGKNCPGAQPDTVSTWRAWGRSPRDSGAKAQQPEGPGLMLCPGDAQSRPCPCPLPIVRAPAPTRAPTPPPSLFPETLAPHSAVIPLLRASGRDSP